MSQKQDQKECGTPKTLFAKCPSFTAKEPKDISWFLIEKKH